jgi:hypothetical protein
MKEGNTCFDWQSRDYWEVNVLGMCVSKEIRDQVQKMRWWGYTEQETFEYIIEQVDGLIQSKAVEIPT